MNKLRFIVSVAIIAAVVVSCKNKTQESAAGEIVEPAKSVIAEEVVSLVDDLLNNYVLGSEKVDVTTAFASSLSERKKLVKPDYLYDPEATNSLVTRSQKINALGILVAERPVRVAFGMPVDKVDEAIAKLAVDVNHPFSVEDVKEKSITERIKNDYAVCKERGELCYFWQFAFAAENTCLYLVAHDPELFLGAITEEQYASFKARSQSVLKAVFTLAEYDEELAAIKAACLEDETLADKKKADELYSTLALFKANISANKDRFVARRAALLK